MLWTRLLRLGRHLPIGLALLFAFQVAAIVPTHHFHGSESSATPDDCRCDFCLAFGGLDHATAVPPPVQGLAETAFAIVAAYHYFTYCAPASHSRARGPPALTA
jgi:hypothetical protein